MAKVKLLHPHPALLFEADKRYVVISDLHIGFESALIAKGINVGSEMYVKEMIKELSVIVEKEKPDALVLLGDIKSSVHTLTKAEWDLVPRFLQHLTKLANVILVPGNHDGNIGHLVPNSVRMISGTGMLLEDTLLTHGHTTPTASGGSINRIIMGHVHPVFLRSGSSVSGQRMWVYIKADRSSVFNSKGALEIIVLPSFNKYFYYSSQGNSYRKSISPILKKVAGKVEKAVMLTLDGSIVGNESLLEQVI